MFRIFKKKNEAAEDVSIETPTEAAQQAIEETEVETPPPATEVVEPATETPIATAPDTQTADAEITAKSGGLFARFKRGLSKTRQSLGEGVATAFLGKKTIDDDLFEELETVLLTADVGVGVTQNIIDSLVKQVKRKALKDPQQLKLQLIEYLISLLKPCEQPLPLSTQKPFVILFTGVNGAGKTTTIGKLAKQFQQQGLKVMLAAGDTFRAAAIEQLQTWGERNQIKVINQQPGADSAAVAFDALQSATAQQIDVLLIDTAGRLHTQSHLMDELAKVKRVLAKIDPSAPHETLLVLDAGIGQNAIRQADEYNKAIGVTGLALTKLDGTAKGGVVFAIADQFKLPIRYIGMGEGIDDLKRFEADAFAHSIFD